jgi:hypothetical protein
MNRTQVVNLGIHLHYIILQNETFIKYNIFAVIHVQIIWFVAYS